MDSFVDLLIERGMGTLMDQSRDELAASDAACREFERKEEEAERRFRSIGLKDGEAAAAEEYLECMRINGHRYADISYMAGIRDAVLLLASLGALRDAAD